MTLKRYRLGLILSTLLIVLCGCSQDENTAKAKGRTPCKKCAGG